MAPEDARPPISDWAAPLFELPHRLFPEAPAWNGHIPFLFLLFDLARPRTYVELGVYRGTSLLAACEAAKRFETDTRCCGVDTWRGDDHTGYYDGGDFYAYLQSLIASRYSSCELVRTTFDEALARFSDDSIDLLHIDGLHTYEAVAQDFQRWSPKLTDRSVVIFHDTEVRTGDFGVWKFWSEVKQRYPSLEFRHSYGLGVLFTGQTMPKRLDGFLQQLKSRHRGVEQLRSECEAAAATLQERMQRRETEHRQATFSTDAAGQRISRNAPCPCGSGKRYKQCHGKLV